MVGGRVGLSVGGLVGISLGLPVGDGVGEFVGENVGSAQLPPPHTQQASLATKPNDSYTSASYTQNLHGSLS